MSIQTNLEADTIGDIMTTTLCVSAHTTWLKVVAPTRLYLKFQTAPSVISSTLSAIVCPAMQEDKDVLYDAFRSVSSIFLSDAPGVDCVLVPAEPPNPRGRKRGPTALDTEDIQPQSKTMKWGDAPKHLSM
ncbi:MAG: hypothetical protein Q9218_003179 [Villophora microphyllina]